MKPTSHPLIGVAPWLIRDLDGTTLLVFMALLDQQDEDGLIRVSPPKLGEILKKSRPTIYRALQLLRRTRLITQIEPNVWDIDPDIGMYFADGPQKMEVAS